MGFKRRSSSRKRGMVTELMTRQGKKFTMDNRDSYEKEFYKNYNKYTIKDLEYKLYKKKRR